MMHGISTVVGFSSYGVDESGCVWSRKRAIRKLRHGKDARGYCRIPLRRDDGKIVCKYVHRLVAEAFLKNPEGLSDIDHVDGDPGNNAVGNLRWVSHRTNMLLAFSRRGFWLKGGRRKKMPIKRISDSGDVVSYDSIKSAIEALGLKYEGTVANICAARKRGGRAYGYRWT